jgi:hypothetical protein
MYTLGKETLNLVGTCCLLRGDKPMLKPLSPKNLTCSCLTARSEINDPLKFTAVIRA